jgi:hypothetical protein
MSGAGSALAMPQDAIITPANRTVRNTIDLSDPAQTAQIHAALSIG